VMDAYLLAASRRGSEPGQIYNIGTGTQTTIRDAVDVARRLLGIEAEPEWGSMQGRSWDTTTWVCDSALIRSELTWEPAYDFEHGLAATIDWMRADVALRERYDRGARLAG
jgi:nucleoside-diphosphate-sugar epimerase